MTTERASQTHTQYDEPKHKQEPRNMGAAESTPSDAAVPDSKELLPKEDDSSNVKAPPTSISGCPMHKKEDGTYSFDPFAIWKAGFPHAPSGSKPLDRNTLNHVVPIQPETEGNDSRELNDDQTWTKILQFEQTLGHESSKLLQVHGRPNDLSPKAMLKHYVFGHPLPFDRHDWFIERDNGEVVRYVLDYYSGRCDQSLHVVDVRPAIDNPRALLDRGLVMPYFQWRQTTAFTPLPLVSSNNIVLSWKEQSNQSQDVGKK